MGGALAGEAEIRPTQVGITCGRGTGCSLAPAAVVALCRRHYPTSIAEYERELVRERTALKLAHARKSGVKFGRPTKLNGDQAALARRMKESGETAATICKTLGIGRTTLYRYLGEVA